MRPQFLISALVLAACGAPSGETPATDTAAPAAPAVPAPKLEELPAPWNAADLRNGATQFAKCKSCHSVKRSEGNMVGPNLSGMFDRRPASAPDFRYSDALKALSMATWTPEAVDQWLERPKDFIPGTAMFFNGIDKPENRRDVIAWLLIETRK
jgi:cytochrome c